MKRALQLIIAAVGGAAAGGTLVALLHNYPKGETALRSYCTRCAMYASRAHEHSVLGARRAASTKSSALTRVLALPPDDHEHVWVEPWAHVFPTFNSPSEPKLGTPEALKNALLTSRLRDLDTLAETPHAVALLDGAMKNDPSRARAFIGRLLDFDRHYPTSAVSLLDRAEEWPARWAAVDAFDRAYRCTSDGRTLECTLTTRGQPKRVMLFDAEGRGQASFPGFRDWAP
jgi:hypothetical protein